MYKNILLAIDGSEQSAKATMHTAELAKSFGSEITLFHVMVISTVADTHDDIKGLIMGETQRQSDNILKQAKEKLSEYNITVKEAASVYGHPAHEIYKKSKEGNYDLLIIGSRGLGEIKSFLMGSVSKQVVQHANCPVLVVR